MTFLVDANVLSEATRLEPNPRVLEWLTRYEREIAVDPIFGEIRFGIFCCRPASAARVLVRVRFRKETKRSEGLGASRQAGESR